MQMVQTLPPQYQRRAKSTYEQFVEEGMEKAIHNLILNKPSFTDQEIAAMLGVELVQVQKVRARTKNY